MVELSINKTRLLKILNVTLSPINKLSKILHLFEIMDRIEWKNDNIKRMQERIMYLHSQAMKLKEDIISQHLENCNFSIDIDFCNGKRPLIDYENLKEPDRLQLLQLVSSARGDYTTINNKIKHLYKLKIEKNNILGLPTESEKVFKENMRNPQVEKAMRELNALMFKEKTIN